MKRKFRKKLKMIKTVIPEVVAYFEDDSIPGNKAPDYRCPECGYGIANDYICCPYCAAELDWKSVNYSSAEFKMVSELCRSADVKEEGESRGKGYCVNQYKKIISFMISMYRKSILSIPLSCLLATSISDMIFFIPQPFIRVILTIIWWSVYVSFMVASLFEYCLVSDGEEKHQTKEERQ